MSVIKGYVPRPHMRARERNLRSQLKKLISCGALARGNLVFRERVCGGSNCKCARGKKHPAVYLDIRYEGKHRQIFIPQSLVEEVRHWTEQYHQVRELLEAISRIYWDKIEKREV